MGKGVKYDGDKPRWGLLPFKQLEEVVDVLTFGSKKYTDGNWKKVENAHERYFDAMLRHISQYRYDEKLDSETKKSHLAHATCCALFMMWFDDQSKETITVQNCTIFPDVLGSPNFSSNKGFDNDGECSLTTEPLTLCVDDLLQKPIDINGLKTEKNMTFSKGEDGVDKSKFLTIDEMIIKIQNLVDKCVSFAYIPGCTETILYEDRDKFDQYVYHGNECEMFMFFVVTNINGKYDVVRHT